MDALYERVLDERYGRLAPRTLNTVRRFYRTLPDPSELTKEYVRERLRHLAPQTQWSYLSFLKPLGEALERDLVGGIRPPRPRSHVQKTDLYTKNELDRVFEACIDTRDRAMFQVLYESGVRASELVELRIADVTPSQNLWWLTVMGKGRKERPVPILHSAPSLQAWLDVHPEGEGALFVKLKRPHSPLHYGGLHRRTLLMMDRAEVRLRRRPIHLFRHTRATELASMGMSEVEMCVFFGWAIGSPMARTYVHLSGRDLKRGMSRIYGLPVEDDDEPALKMESRSCPRCKRVNAPGAKFCSQCSFVLDEKMALTMRPVALPSDEQTVRELIRQELRQELRRLADEQD